MVLLFERLILSINVQRCWNQTRQMETKTMSLILKTKPPRTSKSGYVQYAAEPETLISLRHWKKQLLTFELSPSLCFIRSFMRFYRYTFLLTLAVSPSCSQNATTRPSTAHMFPLWGSTGSPARAGRISCPFAADADEESVEFFPVRFSEQILMPRKCRSTCLWTIIFKNNNVVYIYVCSWVKIMFLLSSIFTFLIVINVLYVQVILVVKGFSSCLRHTGINFRKLLLNMYFQIIYEPPLV